MLRDRAIAALEERNSIGFLSRARSTDALDLVHNNAEALLECGIYEEALLHAFVTPRTNNIRWPTFVLESMFLRADREKLRAAGDPLPSDGPFVLYRGVAGEGRRRRIRGLSWTDSVDVARWFADRFPSLPNRAVYVVTVNASHILACTHEKVRDHRDYILRLPRSTRPTLMERR